MLPHQVPFMGQVSLPASPKVYDFYVKQRQGGFRRRKLSSIVRKAITSYYTDQEQKEIEKAASQQNISKSSFVASAALKEARRLVR
jgi:hypothetical protein